MKMYKRAAALAAALILTAGFSAQATDGNFGNVSVSNQLTVGTNEHDTGKAGMTVNNKGEIHTAGIWNNNGTFGADSSGNVAMTNGTANGVFDATDGLTVGKNEHYTEGNGQPEAGMTVNEKGEIHTAGIWNNNGTFGADSSGNVAMTNGTANGNFTITGDLTVGGANVADSIAQNAAGIAQNAADIEKNGYKADTALQQIGNGVLWNHATNLTDGMNLNTAAIEDNAEAIANETAERIEADKQLQAGIDSNSNAISSLNGRVSDLGGEIDNVGAISAALAGLHPLGYNGTGSKVQIAAAMGDYDGKQAVAFGGFYHFNQDMMMSVGGATTFDGDKKTAYNVGLSVRVGQGSSKKAAVNEDIVAQIEAMNENIAALEAENKDLSEKVTALEAEKAK